MANVNVNPFSGLVSVMVYTPELKRKGSPPHLKYFAL